MAASRDIPKTLARFHPDTADRLGRSWPTFTGEGCPGPIVIHMVATDDGTQWFECFGECEELTEETLAAHVERHGCAPGIGEKLGVTLRHACPSCF